MTTETDFPPRGGHDEDCAYVGFIGDCTCAATGQPKLYRVEFGPAWPVPPITVDFDDRTEATRAVAAHAIPHLTPVLAEKGRPELADCFFRTDRELTEGSFMWINLGEGMSATFCPARLTAVDEPLPEGAA